MIDRIMALNEKAQEKKIERLSKEAEKINTPRETKVQIEAEKEES